MEIQIRSGLYTVVDKDTVLGVYKTRREAEESITEPVAEHNDGYDPEKPEADEDSEIEFE